MPNPRVTVRVPQNLYNQLPTDERERSTLLLQLLNDYYNPPEPAAQLAKMQQQIDALEQAIAKHLKQSTYRIQ
jgi:flagellar biosynthesis chaperone FliJ